jgi:hypothetical protein
MRGLTWGARTSSGGCTFSEAVALLAVRGFGQPVVDRPRNASQADVRSELEGAETA